MSLSGHCVYCLGKTATGCELCNPNTPPSIGRIETIPQGWICPQCQIVNAPMNDRCVNCAPVNDEPFAGLPEHMQPIGGKF